MDYPLIPGKEFYLEEFPKPLRGEVHGSLAVVGLGQTMVSALDHMNLFG
jgi:hypothetical protein